MLQVRVLQGEKKEEEAMLLQAHIIYERQKINNLVPRPRTWPGDEALNVVGGAESQSSKQSAAMQLT